MKTRLCLVLGITAVLGLLACNEDKIISDTQLVNSISVTVQDFLDADPVTRAVYNVDGTGFHFTWSAGDIVGVYPVGGDQVAFPISNGVGTQTAKFDGGAWALRSSYSYAAYYPFASGNYEVNETSIPVNYLGQVQDGNGSLDCLDNYDYQASVATHPDDDGNVNIALKHLGCFARFQFKMPVADTLKSITLTSNNTYFITSGKYDLTKDSIYVIPDSTSSAFSISLLNTVTTDEDKVLTVYAMLAPSDLSDSEIRISIEGTQYKSFITSVSGKNMIAGKAYSYRATIQSGIDINGSYVFWNEEGQEQGPEYVDLGLSVNWATFNVGASKPEEYGDYFAWGEVEPYYEAGYAQVNPETHWKSDKLDGYSWTSYKFCIEGNYYEDVKFSKYNKTYTLGEEVENIVLDPEDDVAHVMWGNDWRMPTRAEFDEIFYYCKWTNIIQNGVNGYLVTSKKAGYEDRSIFLPASGYRLGKNLYSFGDKGYYWLSSLNTIPYESVSFYFGLNNNGWDTSLRECGYSVRPVCPNEKTVESIELSRTEVSLIVGKSIQIKATPKNSGDSVLTTAIQWYSSDYSIAKVSNNGGVTAVGIGTCNITASIGNIKSTCKVSVTESENGYGFVDLGLSVNWATCNVGADQPEDYGGYYAWGETETKNEYSWSNYKWCDGDCDNLTKYAREIDKRGYLYPEDDIAHVEWGGNWRMPNEIELYELLRSCSWKWTELNGIKGYVGTSKRTGFEGRSIFLPAAGRKYDSYYSNVGSLCAYWSRNLHGINFDQISSMLIYFNSTGRGISQGSRYIGYSVRPVCPVSQ